jgi:hypothetical protein
MLNVSPLNVTTLDALPATDTLVALTGLGITVDQGFFNRGVGLLAGYGFDTLPILTGKPIESGLVGAMFGTAPQIYQAGMLEGYGFGTTPTITLNPRNEAFLEGYGFGTNFTGVWISGTNGTAAGRGFDTQAVLLGGGILTGRSFSTAADLNASAPITASLVGRSFSTTFAGRATAFETGRLIGRGFNSDLGFSASVIGRGFETLSTITATFGTDFKVAFVMNVANYQVSRYTNYPFNNIVSVYGKHYGVTEDGLHLLEGETDIDTPVVGSITSKDDDFGDMFSKNVPFAYLGCDDVDISITPTVDDVEYPTYVESFDGRKVKMARGIKGRYWRLRIDNIKKLQSMETIQETLDRRVK